MRMKQVTPFQQKVYTLLQKVPKGKVTTYKEIGKVLRGRGQIYRAVGNALNKNPFAPAVPCHRVVSSDGFLGGFTHGTEAKIKLLKKEGIDVMDGKIVEFEKRLWKFHQNL